MIGRLVHSVDFQRVLATAPKARSAHFAAHHVADWPSPAGRARKRGEPAELSTDSAPKLTSPVDNSPVDGHWLGLVVPKRGARRSVTRQLLKRQMREAMRRHVEGLPAGLWVLRLRQGFEPREFPSAASRALRVSARTELDVLLERAARR